MSARRGRGPSGSDGGADRAAEALVRLYAERTAAEAGRERAQDEALARTIAARVATPAEARPRLGRRIAIAAPIPVLVVLLVLRMREPLPALEVTAAGAALGADGRVEAPADRPATLAVSDGSRIELRPGAAAQVTATAAAGARLALTRGRIAASVVDVGPTPRLFVHAGPFEVSSPGGRLEVSWAPGESLFGATLAAGVAIVKGPLTDGGITLRPGQRISVDLVAGGLSLDRAPARGEAPRSAADPRAPQALVTELPPAGAAAAPIETGWLGNSAGGADRLWVPRLLTGLATTPDGLILAMGGDDEENRGLADAPLVQDGRIVGRLANLEMHLGRGAGRGAAADERYFYAAVDQWPPSTPQPGDYPPRGSVWYGVRRYDHRGAPAPFPGGRGVDGSFLFVGGEPVAAVAVAAGELFVAHEGDGGAVAVFDAASMAPKRRFAFPAPRALAVDRRGHLWLASARTGAVTKHDGAGAPLGAGALAGIGRATALAVDAAGRLLVADDGPRQQVLVFDLEGPTPRIVRAIGAPGGLLATRGADVDPRRFLGLTAVGSDQAGIVYVGMTPARQFGARLVAIGLDDEPRWELSALTSYDSAGVDPASDGEEVYTRLARFRLEASAGAAPGASGARWVGWTLDPVRYPEDPRLDRTADSAVDVLRLDGARLLVDVGTTSKIRVHRFEPQGEIAAPAVIFGHGRAPGLPDDGPARRAPGWFWRDSDGDGRPQAAEYEGFDLPPAWGAWVDARGGIWRVTADAGIDHFPYEGLDARGVPRYRLGGRVHVPMPAPFSRIHRLVVDAEADTAYLSGFTAERPSPYRRQQWTAIGTEIARYDAWRGERRLRWRAPILEDDRLGHRPAGFAVAGGRLFVTYVNDSGIAVFDAETGRRLGRFSPGANVGGLDTGRVAMPLRAFARSTGEILLFAADPIRSKVVTFRVPAGWGE